MKTKNTNIFSFWITLSIVLSSPLFFTACSDENEPEPKPEVLVTAITPLTARVGEEITITGSGFSGTPSQNQVLFSGEKEAVVTEASATQLTVTVPEGAENGPITIRVGEAEGVSAQEFTLDTTLPAPVLTSLDPTHGSSGQQVTITGDYFSNVKENITVKFGEVEAAEIVSVSNTSIVVVVPAEAVVGEVQVSVLRESVAAMSMLNFTVDPLPREVRNSYWSNLLDNTINVGTIDGESKTQQVLYDDALGVSGARGVAVDVAGGYIYWCNSATVVRAKLDGTSASLEILFTGVSGATDLALDLENQMVYFTRASLSTGRIYRGSMEGGGTPQLLYTLSGVPAGANGMKLRLASDAIYWTEPGTVRIRKGALDGSTEPETVYEGGLLVGPFNIAIDEVNNKLYIVDRSATGATNSDNIFVGSLDGAAALQSILASGDNVNAPNDIEIDVEGGYIYWLNYADNGQIMRAGLDGSGPESLFDGIDFGNFFDLDIR